MALQMWRQANK